MYRITNDRSYIFLIISVSLRLSLTVSLSLFDFFLFLNLSSQKNTVLEVKEWGVKMGVHLPLFFLQKPSETAWNAEKERKRERENLSFRLLHMKFLRFSHPFNLSDASEWGTNFLLQVSKPGAFRLTLCANWRPLENFTSSWRRAQDCC